MDSSRGNLLPEGRLESAVHRVEENPVYQYLLVIGITLLAAAIRFVNLGEWSFWIDEIFTINRARAHTDIVTVITQWWRTPPSVVLTDWALEVFGTSEWSARLVAALIGIITLPIIFYLCKKLFNPWVGLGAALLLAVAPWHIFWSQNARFYTSLMVFYFIASVAMFLFIERGQFRYLVIFGFFFLFALAERFLAVAFVPVLIAYLLALWVLPFEKPTGLTRKSIVLLALPAIAFAALELYNFISTGSTRLGSSLATFWGHPIDSPLRIAILIVFNIGIPLVILALLSGVLVFREKNRTALFFLLNALIPTILFVVASQFFFVVDRYTFIALPSWIILAAYGIHAISLRYGSQGLFVSLALIAVLLADAGGANLLYFNINHGNRPEWKRAFAFVAERMEDGDQVVSSVPEVGNYYMDQSVKALGGIDPDGLEASDDRVWFVLDSENSWFSPIKYQWVAEHADLVEFFYLRVRETMNIQVLFYSADYEKP